MSRSVRRWLSGPASRAPVPVFAARGLGAGHALDSLRLRPELRLVDSPRLANALLVAGRITDALAEPLAQVHDQLPQPRATVWWTSGEPPAVASVFGVVASEEDEAVEELTRARGRLLRGAGPGEPPVLPDREPAEWRGVGPYGQGGKGMTGGVPYGRPIAGRADDLRDGLSLDVIVQRVGPFLSPFPAGLVLDVTIQGDIVQAVEPTPPAVGVAPDPELAVPRGGGPLPDPDREPFERSRSEPVRVTTLEMARARHHLRWLAAGLRLYGMEALALRVLRLARGLTLSDGNALRELAKRLDRPWVLGRVTAGVGRIDPETAAAFGGCVARAAGIEADPRTGIPAYRDLRFAPVVGSGGDVRARWRQRLAEAEQSLDLASRAGEREVRPDEGLDPPWTTAAERGGDGSAATLLPDVLVGLEWGDAIATIVSLDLDLEDRVAEEVGAPA